MKKIVSILLVFTVLTFSTTGVFAATTYSSQVSYAMKSSILANKMLTPKEAFQIESEIAILNNYHIDTSIIKRVNMKARGNEYILNYKNVDEKVIIESSDNESITIVASDGKKSNVISFMKDGSIILDGYKVQLSQVDQMDTNIAVMANGTVWKSEKSLSPYGSLTPSDYDDYLSSGKQNIDLGKALDELTITALSAVIGLLHPYLGIAVSLATVARGVYNVLVEVNPETEYLGCAYITYIAGASDYKYINKFYANKECTGTYRKEISYEHFIVY
ncbi:hypothetical protein [Caldisalinibacter kiritimatiensis]|uniref:Uncharacterized protein n=1 Tax=Caldisalinibacter kiritimatiensis TaxID=1304284 RepID=R1CC43_9FIRM|nr:hypothetical protein [Caldisalinibacter kiritimatiensis]EOC99874.1 hypothetical protein L21TH_2098 [Caldisalinibacter kiritimatiensis]